MVIKTAVKTAKLIKKIHQEAICGGWNTGNGVLPPAAEGGDSFL
jgi:hypothetical protein